MERKRIVPELEQFPAQFHPLLEQAAVFDSSCSQAARVYYIEKDRGMYLKKAPAGSLGREAEMDRFFHGKGLGPEVLSYESGENDWLLTRAVPGEDCTFHLYKEDPTRLCDTTAQLLRMLHDTDPADCPVQNRTAEYLAAARRSYEYKAYDASLFPDNWGYASAEEAWAVVERYGEELNHDTLLHGDYCLPNIMLEDWKFSGFIDLDAAGMGDRHVYLFWGIWSLEFNLKTDRFRDRFLDAYGRERINEELLKVVAAIEVFG